MDNDDLALGDGFDPAFCGRFLRHILPPGGPYCPYSKGLQPQPLASIDETVAWFARHADRDCNIALACWSGARGAKGTFAGARAFWVDLDIGENRQFASQPAAVDYLNALIGRGLPNPTIIGSGTGLHLIWLLNETLTDQQDWQARAEGLGAHLSTLGLEFDRARIRDCVNGPRCPGTINQKCGDLVRVMRWGRLAHPRDVWDRLVPPQYPEPAAKRPSLDDSNFLAAPIAERCAQIRAFRDGTRLPEPVWKACIDVLAHCRDGDQVVHEWSAKDPRYRREETQDKLDRAEEARPALCARFRNLNPQTCQGCPEKINSPISLGRSAQSQSMLPAKYYLKDGFIWTTTQEDIPIVVCKELYIIAVAQTTNGILRYKIKFDDGAILWLNRREIETRAAVQLRDKIWTRSPSIFEAYITEATLLAHRRDKNMARLYSVFGWDDCHSFVLGPAVIGQNSASSIENAAYDEVIRACIPRGSFEKWRVYAGRICQQEITAFLLCLSAGTPIHYLLAPSEGGIVVLLRSFKSGRGKTTALAAALSIWGNWHELQVSNTGSEYARQAKVGFIRHLPVGWDDALTDIQQFYKQIMEFSEGHPRERLNRDGTPKPRELNWSTYLLGTTNSALRLQLGTTKTVTQGGLARIFELDAKLDMNDGGELLDSFGRHYGHAGQKIIAALLANPEVIGAMREQLQQATLARMKRLCWASGYRYIARAITCAEAGGELLRKIGLELDVQRIISTVETEVNTASEKREWYAGGDVVNQYIYDNVGYVIIVGGTRPPAPLRGIRARYEVKTRRLYLPLNEWRRWCAEINMSEKELMQLLIEQKHQIDSDMINLTEGTGEPSGVIDHCVRIIVAKGMEIRHDPDDPKIVELKPRKNPPPDSFRIGEPDDGEPDDDQI